MAKKWQKSGKKPPKRGQKVEKFPKIAKNFQSHFFFQFLASNFDIFGNFSPFFPNSTCQSHSILVHFRLFLAFFESLAPKFGTFWQFLTIFRLFCHFLPHFCQKFATSKAPKLLSRPFYQVYQGFSLKSKSFQSSFINVSCTSQINFIKV